jgi:hypoxanthine phosphoribosyltransferase
MCCCGVTPVAADLSAAVLDWAEITKITDQLARAVSADAHPDTVVGILRGGMIPAVRLAHVLKLRDVRALDVTHTIADGIDAAKTPRPLLRNAASLGDLTGLDVLLIDDVAGTGETITASRGLLQAAGAARVRTAACVLNEINWSHASDRDPSGALTYIGASYRGWVMFPWETR